MVLSLACLNINGGRAPKRKTHVRLLLDQKHVDVALLQDVRCGPTCSAEWQTTIRSSWFFSSLTPTQATGIMVVRTYSLKSQAYGKAPG